MSRLGAFGKLLAGIDGVAEGLRDLGLLENGLQTIEINPVKELPKLTAKREFVGTIEGRIERIKKLIVAGKRHPDVQRIAANCLNRRCGGKWCIPEKDFKKEVKAIFAEVRKRSRYMSDPNGVDTFRHPRHTLRSVEEGGFGGGDCDDLSIALASLLEAAGYETKLRVVSVKPDPNRAWSHILVMVGLPPRSKVKAWIPLDASVDKPAGWYPEHRFSGFKDFPIPRK